MQLQQPGPKFSVFLHIWLMVSFLIGFGVLIYMAVRTRGDNIYKCGAGTLADNEQRQCVPLSLHQSKQTTL